MSKKTIGKIQLVLAIIILLIGIVGIIGIYSFNNMFASGTNLNADSTQRSISLIREGQSFSFMITWIILFVIIIILSLLFITQGLVNLSTINK